MARRQRRSLPAVAAIAAAAAAAAVASTSASALSLSASRSAFRGAAVPNVVGTAPRGGPERRRTPGRGGADLEMRKQKASDRRTRRMQRGGDVADAASEDVLAVVAASSMSSRGAVLAAPTAGSERRRKSVVKVGKVRNAFPRNNGGGGASGSRGRSRKRSAVYSALAAYHGDFLNLLTAEYRCEEAEVLGRIEASIDDPLGLEAAGHALFDMRPERRGNIFTEEIYRLVKAEDAATSFAPPVVFGTSADSSAEGRDEKNDDAQSSAGRDRNRDRDEQGYLPPNHKFASNDVVVLTLQPRGSGDFFGTSCLPSHKDCAASLEARVLNTGPAYVEVAVPGGAFGAAFGPAPNDKGLSGGGDPGMRLRVDRFFSRVPYDRMAAAVGRATTLPEKRTRQQLKQDKGDSNGKKKPAAAAAAAEIAMDEVIREAIVSTYASDSLSGGVCQEPDEDDFSELGRKLAKPPLPNSAQLANQALGYMRTNPHGIFPAFNGPQMAAIGAALTRRLTMIQGPPGTGKTTVAAAAAFGFVHQCRNVSPYAKVLACAFSNVGADNLAEALVGLGLNVVRVGKASGISENLWDRTLDAAIERDPEARRALRDAARATANLEDAGRRRRRANKKGGGGTKRGDVANARNRREAATSAVRASIEACNVAATRALRAADVIVCTSVGAADPRLLAACGIAAVDDEEEERTEADGRAKKAGGGGTGRIPRGENAAAVGAGGEGSSRRERAPDGLPPLTLPFVIVDEACQSVEPATLIPVTSSDSCRSLVMLGDPCQLPPTVKSDASGTGNSPLSVSLMARLASSLPSPVIVTARADKTKREDFFLKSLPTKQAVSLVNYRSKGRGKPHVSYRKRYSGSLLLSVQYRMHPSISAFSSAVFYDGLLSTPASLARSRPFPESLKEHLPTESHGVGVRFVNVGGRNNERKGEKRGPELSSAYPSASVGANTSYRNEPEANQIVATLKELLRGDGSDDMSSPRSIGIVTPYASQVALLKSLMASDSDLRSLLKDSSTTIEVKSVDGYQGRERDVIIFSAVRSNRRGGIGFLADWRRMNVALTRAKSGLVVFGDLETLKDGDRHWEAFANWCEGVGCLTNAE